MTTVESLQFDFATIEAATNKFSNDHNKIGEGGFSTVYIYIYIYMSNSEFTSFNKYWDLNCTE
jgi:hypothetical protein